MLVILSPARKIRPYLWEQLPLRKPQFQVQTETLAALLRQYSQYELESLLQVNPKLAFQTYCFYQDFAWEHAGIPALLAYDGLVFQHLQPEKLSLEDYLYADQHLRILSAFYGMLRPCDEIMPYRLEIESKLNLAGQTLYQYWGSLIYQQLFVSGQPVVNLASAAYSKMITPWLQPDDAMISIAFCTMRRGNLRTITTAAKMARGQMANWIIRNRIESPEDLKQFSGDHYQFAQNISTVSNYVFIQKS